MVGPAARYDLRSQTASTNRSLKPGVLSLVRTSGLADCPVAYKYAGWLGRYPQTIYLNFSLSTFTSDRQTASCRKWEPAITPWFLVQTQAYDE